MYHTEKKATFSNNAREKKNLNEKKSQGRNIEKGC